MSNETKYTCAKCGAKVRLGRWAECQNCGEIVPESIRAAYAKQRQEDQTATWQSLLDLPPATRSSSTRKGKTERDSSASADEGRVPSWNPANQVSADAKAIILAQDRTTHAVRALTVFFFMNLFWTSAAFLMFTLANLIPTDSHCYGYGDCTKTTNGFALFLYFVTFAIAVVGIIVTIRESMKELLLSRVKPTRM